jgi:dTDP-4-amino-4,6-dideoxygalactose transaminase
VHRQQAYRALAGAHGPLPATEAAAERVITLPLWTGMTEEHIAGVQLAFARITRAFGPRRRHG